MGGWMKRYIFYYLITYTVIALAQGEDLNRLCFIGMIGMWDPPRIGVISAISELTNGGVDVKMITGDSLETAQAIGMIHLIIIYVYLSLHLSHVFILHLHPSMYPFLHQSIHLSIHLSIYPYINPFIYSYTNVVHVHIYPPCS